MGLTGGIRDAVGDFASPTGQLVVGLLVGVSGSQVKIGEVLTSDVMVAFTVVV